MFLQELETLEQKLAKLQSELDEKLAKLERERQQEGDTLEKERFRLHEIEEQERVNTLVEQEVSEEWLTQVEEKITVACRVVDTGGERG